ncbi:MAG: hypothetical protein U0892_13390 [Pirellulales bacterium]
MKLAEGEERGQVVEEQKTQPKLASFVMDEVMAVDEVQGKTNSILRPSQNDE